MSVEDHNINIYKEKHTYYEHNNIWLTLQLVKYEWTPK